MQARDAALAQDRDGLARADADQREKREGAKRRRDPAQGLRFGE
jgi:hypothetical protein